MTARYPLVLNGTSIQELQAGDTITGLAASGANSDITSLSGLTTALSVAQGGSGNTAFTAPSGNVKGLVFFDGTKLATDTTVTDVGYDTTTNTVKANNFNATGTSTLGTLTGILKGATGVVSAASAGTDYVAPGGALGTPSSGTLTNATGLPISTGVSGLGTGVATFLATPSSANLASAMTDETGSGALVFGTGPTLTNPTITNYTETLYAPSAGSAFTVDLANGTVQKLTSNANLTVTLPSSTAGKSYVIMVSYGGTHTLTWAGGGTIKWAGGTAPTATSTSGKIDIFTFFCDGTNTYGQSFGLNY